MSNNTINTLIKNINRQRPALNELIKKGESIVQRNEKKLMHLKSERTRLIKSISITEKKLELVISKLSYAKAVRDAINDEFKNYDTIKLKNKNTPVKLRKLSNNINKTVNNFKDLK